jgi:choline dehydrogenase-like flavoprotein
MRRLPEVDVVVVGMGWSGSILARELTRAGLHVVGLERGPARSPAEDFVLPAVRDELKYVQRQELFQDAQTETVTMRHEPGETALPIRRFGAFLPGTGVGGAGSHWNGLTWRLLPSDLALRTRLTLAYDKTARRVRAVEYVDARSGEEIEQPASLVILAAYVFNNALLLLTSGIGAPYDHQSTHNTGGTIMGRTQRPASSTGTSRAGTQTTCLSWARRCFRRMRATTRPAPSARSRTGRPPQSSGRT